MLELLKPKEVSSYSDWTVVSTDFVSKRTKAQYLWVGLGETLVGIAGELLPIRVDSAELDGQTFWEFFIFLLLA